jgi:DNA polymerase III subunit delta
MKKPQTVDFFKIQKDIEKNSLKPIYLIYGEESYLHNVIQDTIRINFGKNKQSVNYEIFYGENIDFNSFINSVKSLPLGIEKQLVILKNFEKLGSAYAKKLEYLINNKSFQDNAITIFIFSLTKKIPTNIPLSKIRKYGSVISLKKPKSFQVKEWINQKLNEKRVKILPEALYYLQKLTDNDLGRINNEIEKILCYLGEERLKITREDVINNFFGSEEGNIFSFVDAIGEKKTGQALTLLRNLNENEYHPLSLLAMISRQLKLILKAKLYNGNQKKIKGDTNLPPFVIDKLIKQSQKYQIDNLKKTFYHLLDAEIKIKTGHFSPVMVLEQLVIKITN